MGREKKGTHCSDETDWASRLRQEGWSNVAVEKGNHVQGEKRRHENRVISLHPIFTIQVEERTGRIKQGGKAVWGGSQRVNPTAGV